ncbi:Na+/H+ antiporter subunit E [Alkaliphilus peptidifermentans]|uniref:Multisubunit sodium/proton antiporter, MrpE subunit n=1 Tax=Alkaliphilus peptidifermentans DSM 18978 TaxID=1120976 RepID=A0A1G5GF09_9FIRM|nr:Na+/H+ antiporter subunit E [Alkaliphilus peptidifermentans]SCY49850.1 multisubunit sodium/proton antiporter, MrpE subunit [Alkaliphilus peptidifermentans DSM 18978]
MKFFHVFFTKKAILLFIPLLLFWLILSPALTVETIIIGFVICWGVVLFSKDIIFSEDETSLYSLRGLKNFFMFLITLVVEIIKANIDVAKIVLSPSLPITPCFVKIPNTVKKDTNKVLLANAITLTPGTLTVDLTEEGYVIHALTKEAGDAIKGSALEEAIIKLEGEE